MSASRLGIHRERLVELAARYKEIRKLDGTLYSQRAIRSWRAREGKLPPHEVIHGLASGVGVSMGWLYGEGPAELPGVPQQQLLTPPPAGGEP